MRTLFLFTLLLLGGYCFSFGQEQLKDRRPIASNPLASKMDRDIDAVVRRYLKRQKTVGVEVGILKNDQAVYYGYGETQRGNGQLPDKHTIFEIGSITKTFTATLLAKAVADGKVKLEDPVSKYLPDSLPVLAFRGMPATLLTLANHTSGLPGNPTNIKYPPSIKGVWTGDPFKGYDDNDLFTFYAHFALKRKPGGKSEYSNLGFGTLGVILERAYGKPFQQLIAEEISGPLGLADTRPAVLPGDTARIAHGYAANGQPALAWHAEALAACGLLRSTAADLLRYAQAEMGQAPPSLATAISLTHRKTYQHKGDSIGLAWDLGKIDGSEWIWHGGATGGFGSFLILAPQKHIALVLLSNNPLGVDRLAIDILSVLEKEEK